MTPPGIDALLRDSAAQIGQALDLPAREARLEARLLLEHLQEHYALIHARDGEEAWQMLQSEPAIELVITDVLMPRMGARGLVKYVRSLRPSMPVLCTSGYAEGKSDPERMIPDDVPFLLKPWRTNDLLVQLLSLLYAPSALI